MVGHTLLVKNFRALVKSERLAHGYLFFGSEGVGKRLFALSLANFLENGEFDFDEDKQLIFNDLILIEPNENKTIGIDAVRELKNFLSQRPNKSLRRTAIIDEAEFLTTEAQNALLKITEEPPESSLLILIAREPEIFAATLGSRLQRIYFSVLSLKDVEEGLKNRIMNYELGIVKKAAEDSRGSFGLAVKMLQDEKFQATSKLAEKFLKISFAERKDFLKSLLEPEDFDILNFLDAVILTLASKQKVDYNLWHRTLKLRQDISNFPLNPKLQLTSLLANGQ